MKVFATIKKCLLIEAVVLITMFATGVAKASVVNIPKGIYPSMGVVTKVKERKDGYYRVTLREGNGNRFSWIDDDPSWCKGDFVATIMFDNGTKRVYDDKVIDARYVGYKELF